MNSEEIVNKLSLMNIVELHLLITRTKETLEYAKKHEIDEKYISKLESRVDYLETAIEKLDNQIFKELGI